MSYCRWSCLGGQSDLYAYADVHGGVTLHVSAWRRVLTPDVPEDPTAEMISGKISHEEWSTRYKARNAAIDECEVRAIGLSRDGQGFNFDFEEAADFVASLRKEGYLIPEGVEDAIREDMEEETKMTLWSEVAKISAAVENGRTLNNIFMHALTELGELAQEVIISDGRSYKEPGKDGVAGEAMDLILCLTDLILLRAPTIDELRIAEVWFSSEAERTEGYLPQSLFGAALKEPRKTGSSTDDLMMAITSKLGEVSQALADAAAGDMDGLDLISSPALDAIFDCVEIIRLDNPAIDEAGLCAMAAPKLEKWRETAHQTRTPSLVR